MRRSLKLFLFLAVSLFFLIAASLFRIVLFLVPYKRRAMSAGLTVLWARATLAVLGISVTAEGREHLAERGMLIASNHQSYLDIIILASTVPALFVAKREVRSWPLLGWLATLGGTLYIDRSAFRGAIAAMENIVRALREKVNVIIFPEGTSTNGEQIIRFKPSLFRSALLAKRSVLPVTINYRSVNGVQADRSNCDLFCWYGEMTFTDHFWALLKTHALTVSVTFHPIIPFSPLIEPDRFCERTFDAVSAGFEPFTDEGSANVNIVSR